MTTELSPSSRDDADAQLIEACKNGDIQLVRQLTPHTNVFAKLGQPIQWAVQYGYLDIVQELWPYYHSSEKWTTGLLHMAALHGHEHVVDFFMPHLANPQTVKSSMLAAATRQHIPVLQRLLQYPNVVIPQSLLDLATVNGMNDVIDVIYPYCKDDTHEEFLTSDHAEGSYLKAKFDAHKQAHMLTEAVDPEQSTPSAKSKM